MRPEVHDVTVTILYPNTLLTQACIEWSDVYAFMRHLIPLSD
jgi:hypothetical protein